MIKATHHPKPCEQCGQPIPWNSKGPAYYAKLRFCCSSCARKHGFTRLATPDRPCQHCGAMIPGGTMKKYCGLPCKRAAAANKARRVPRSPAVLREPDRHCRQCQAVIGRRYATGTYLSPTEYARREFCGNACHTRWQAEHPESRISGAKKGECDSAAYLPTPEEIASHVARFQACWTDADYYERAGVPRPTVELPEAASKREWEQEREWNL